MAATATASISGSAQGSDYQEFLEQNVGTEDLAAWEERKAKYNKSEIPLKPDLTFGEFMKARDDCREHKGDPSFRSKHFLFNLAFFCDTNRLWDVVTQELQKAIEGQDKLVQVTTIVLLRMAGSPRNEEKPGQSGSEAIVKAVIEGFNVQYVTDMPFSGRRTYRAVLSRQELAIIGDDVVTACNRTSRSARASRAPAAGG